MDILDAALKSTLHPRILGLHPVENIEKVLPPLIQSHSGQLVLLPGFKAHIPSPVMHLKFLLLSNSFQLSLTPLNCPATIWRVRGEEN